MLHDTEQPIGRERSKIFTFPLEAQEFELRGETGRMRNAEQISAFAIRQPIHVPARRKYQTIIYKLILDMTKKMWNA